VPVLTAAAVPALATDFANWVRGVTPKRTVPDLLSSVAKYTLSDRPGAVDPKVAPLKAAVASAKRELDEWKEHASNAGIWFSALVTDTAALTAEPADDDADGDDDDLDIILRDYNAAVTALDVRTRSNPHNPTNVAMMIRDMAAAVKTHTTKLRIATSAFSSSQDTRKMGRTDLYLILRHFNATHSSPADSIKLTTATADVYAALDTAYWGSIVTERLPDGAMAPVPMRYSITDMGGVQAIYTPILTVVGKYAELTRALTIGAIKEGMSPEAIRAYMSSSAPPPAHESLFLEIACVNMLVTRSISPFGANARGFPEFSSLMRKLLGRWRAIGFAELTPTMITDLAVDEISPRLTGYHRTYLATPLNKAQRD
jgi:hypothetical protein